MGLIRIRLRGKLLMKRRIDDSEELGAVEEEFRSFAELAGIEPDALAKRVVLHVGAEGLDSYRTARAMEKLGLLWYVLNSEYDDSSRPGRIAGYVAQRDHEFDLKPDAATGLITCDIRRTTA